MTWFENTCQPEAAKRYRTGQSVMCSCLST